MRQNGSIQSTNKRPELASVAPPALKVVGLGGGGCNAVERMIDLGVSGVTFIAANTDHQSLQTNPAETKLLLGPRTTRGLGAGGDPGQGRAAAWESKREIAQALSGADMVFLTAGMGGGTGTGAIPVVAEIARAMGIVTVAVVTTPFSFEMGRRQKNANEGLNELHAHTHTLIAIPNDRLLKVAPRNLPLNVAFNLADDVLRQSVQGVAELITEPGLINVDFSHIKRLIQTGGGALMSIGHGQGENKAQEALQQAQHHPLLEDVSLDNAAGVIANFTGGDDLSLIEVQTALSGLQTQIGSQTEIVPGVVTDKRMNGRVQLILIVTGLGSPTLEDALSGMVVHDVKRVTENAEVSQPAMEARPVLESAEMMSIRPPIVSPKLPAPSSTNLDLPAFLRYRAG